MSNWRRHVGEKLPFFDTEIGGRIVRVSALLRQKEEGNIVWYLATKTKSGHWSTPWLRLEDMEQIGLLFLALSKFCKKTRYMNETSYDRIRVFKKKWRQLAKMNFKDLRTKSIFTKELMEKCGIL